MKKTRHGLKAEFWFPALTLFLITGWTFFSALSLSPVPWPDGSAFYLPALDLFHWPPQWRMHSQAAWVPTYDQANFNLMPALPIYLGLFAKPWVAMGLDATQVIRALSWIPFLFWGMLFWFLARRTFSLSRPIAGALLMASMLDPIGRWATLVVRTEVWVACAALGVLIAIKSLRDRQFRSIGWALPVFLALGAYFHFEAILLVPAAAWGLLPSRGSRQDRLRQWWKNVWEVGLKTALLLLPWIVYVLRHWDLFWIQMETQFKRLEHGNALVSNLYLGFHSMFISFGNVADLPKFLVVGKALFWTLLFGVVSFFVFRFFRDRSKITREEEVAFLLFAAASYLWATKGEVWFISLVHWTFWPCLAAAFSRSLHPTITRTSVALVILLSGLFLTASIGQQVKTPANANWRTYQTWVDCLVDAVEIQKPGSGQQQLVIFQPHVPDVLVRLSQIRPNWDLTRALDFPFLRGQAESFLAQRADIVLLTRVFSPSPESRAPMGDYRGPLRPLDRELLSTEHSVPFGPLALKLAKVASVCQVGPFWGVVTRPASERFALYPKTR